MIVVGPEALGKVKMYQIPSLDQMHRSVAVNPSPRVGYERH